MNVARCSLFVFLLVMTSSVARAGDPRFKVTTPAQCGGAPEFQNRLDEFLPQSAAAAASHVSAVVRIESEASAFALTLEIREDDKLTSQRVIRHPTSCPLLLRIAALIVSMALDPDAVELPVELLSSEGVTVSSAEAPAGPEPVPTPLEPVAETPSGMTGRAHMFIGVDGAGTGGIAPSFAAGGGIVRGRLLADATFVVDGPRRTNIDGDPNYRTRILAMTLELAACARLVRARFVVAGCPRVDVGMVQAVIETVAMRPTKLEARVRASAEARVGFAVIPRIELEIRAFAGVDVLTPTFDWGGSALVPRLDAGASLGVGFAFR